MFHESGLNHRAKNSIGATGLIQFMPACLSTDTEILTTDGWKTFLDVDSGTEILSYNEILDKIEVDTIQNIAYYKSNDCYRIYNKQFDFIATSNHRWYCDYNGSTKIKTTQELSQQNSLYKFIRAKKFNFKSKENNNLFYELMGIIIGDGSIGYSGNTISIYQSISTKPKIVERINYITKTLYNITYSNHQPGMVRWHIGGDNARNISKFFINDNIHKINQKVLNKKLLLGLSEYELLSLKMGLMETDGTMQYDKYEQFIQCDFDRISDFQIICLLLGEMGNIKYNKRNKLQQLFPCGKYYNVKPYKYHINIQKSPLTECRKIRMNYKKIEETIDVWCPETKNHTWIARRNGFVTITGNTMKWLKTDSAKLQAMSNVEQLEYVYRYYKSYGKRFKNAYDMYVYAFMPIGVGKPDNWVFEAKNLPASIVAKQNKVFDLNKDGKITMAEFKKYVKDFFDKYEINPE
jgi:hypothetical protein